MQTSLFIIMKSKIYNKKNKKFEFLTSKNLAKFVFRNNLKGN